MKQTEDRLVHNQKGNCHYDHIPLSLNVIRRLFLRVYQFELSAIFSHNFYISHQLQISWN